MVIFFLRMPTLEKTLISPFTILKIRSNPISVSKDIIKSRMKVIIVLLMVNAYFMVNPLMKTMKDASVWPSKT